MIRSHFSGWCAPVDRLLSMLTDEDLASSPFPHFRHPVSRTGRSTGDLSNALRWYETTRRRKVGAVSRMTSLQVSQSEGS
jgi:FAD-dependent urate hydroxylase